jgi:maleylpyruvate isomerase
VDAERDRLLRLIDGATGRLLGTVAGFGEEDVRRASLLPGWTRGHVLTHVARSGDAMRRLLGWAATGEPVAAYAGPEAREAEIEAGSGRPGAELRDDVARSAAAFRAAAVELPEAAWRVPVRVLDGAPFPAAQLLLRRLVEVELHHADLGAGYGPADWPPEFGAMPLPEPMAGQRADRLRRSAGSR